MKAIDSQISERYDAWIENTRQNLSEGLKTLKGKIFLEEFRERRMKHALSRQKGRIRNEIDEKRTIRDQKTSSWLNLTEEAQLMKRFIQHGRISTYEHVLSVTRLSFYLNRRLHLGASDSELVRGAFLHDFYLYDWHISNSHERLHGFHHPSVALKKMQRS